MSLTRKTLIIGASITLLIVAPLYYSHKTKSCSYRVAILLPAVHPSMDQIEKGFTGTLKEKMPDVSITVFNANGDKILMKGQVEKIINDDFDLVFTVGTNASQLTKTTLKKKQKQTPLIFAAITNPEKRGLYNPNDANERVTGVTESYDYNDQVDMLVTAKPAIKNVLIVYDPSSNPALEELKNTLKTALEKRGITLTEVSVFNAKELQQKVPVFLANADVLLTLTDHTICSGMDTLIKLCSRSGVTLFTSELDSNKKGAALSYGVHESDYGKEGALQAYEILHNHTNPHDVPIRSIQDFYLLVNTDTAADQRVTITPELRSHPRVVLNGKG